MDNKVLAMVNGTEITEKDLEMSLSKFPQDRKRYFMSEEGRSQLLEQVVAWEVIYDYAVDNGFENKKEFLDELKQAKKAILTQTAIQELLSKVEITEDEMKAYYAENIEEFVKPEQVKASHILVQTEEKAKEVLEILNNGMEFEEAAQLFSECPSKAQGGDLGYFAKGSMVPEFEDASFSLEVGKISSPVKTQFGYHIIKVVDRNEEGYKDFDEVKSTIGGRILQQKQGEVYLNFVEDLKKKYEVKML